MKGKKASVRNLLLISKDRNLYRQLRACLIATGLPAITLIVKKDIYACKTVLGKVHPHLIILDDGIGKEDSLSLLREVHQQVPGVYVIYLTTRHTVELERTVRQLGVLYYTEKPPDPALLGQLLTSAFPSLSEAMPHPLPAKPYSTSAK
jgi:DNA-binding response OmpR family regulator